MVAPSWASRTLGADPAETLAAFQGGLTVSLIATERAAFETCAADEPLALVVERNRANAFDFLPVIESAPGKADSGTRIIGLMEIFPFMHGEEPKERFERECCP